jgi:hypothetical protein
MGLFDFLAPDVDGQRTQQRFVQRGREALNDGKKKAVRAIDEGYNEAQSQYGEASEVYDPIMEDRGRATDMYYNSLGLNGQEGYDAALGAFQNGPGFQTALDMANQNVLRNNAAMGGVASGNTGIALSDRARGLQNLEFGNWQNRLQGLDVYPVANSKASALQGLGNMFAREGDATSGVYTQMAPHIAGQYNNQASLIGQQQMMNANAQQQGISNALGLAGMFTGLLGA